jgi:effector-binding domain-containing protein
MLTSKLPFAAISASRFLPFFNRAFQPASSRKADVMKLPRHASGKYSDCGAGFARLGKAVGRYICGKPLNLYYDGEYREDDADIEPCVPIRREVAVDGVTVRTLPGGRGLTLMHRGPYDQLGRSYAKILKVAGERKLNLALPSREVYIKGPGMIFKGSPKNYLTEIQLPFVD